MSWAISWWPRWAGVKVLTFSLGFGPELVGFNDRMHAMEDFSGSARRLP